MEGLAITPDGRTLVGAMQSPLAQDGGDVKGGVTRLITIDIKTGATHEYAYQLDRGTKTTDQRHRGHQRPRVSGR